MPKHFPILLTLLALLLAACADRKTLSGHVWEDLNHNGVQDSDEPGIAGIKVSIHRPDGTEVESTNTDSSGNYRIEVPSDLRPGGNGSGFVSFAAPTGYQFTLENVGDDSFDSDVDVSGRSTEDSGVGAIDAGMYVVAGDIVDLDPESQDEPATESEPEPEPAEVIFGPFTDPEGDEVHCDDASETTDPTVDILEVRAEQVGDTVFVTVTLNGSAAQAAEDFSVSIQARLGQTGAYQVGIYEYHDGEPKLGRLETTTEVYPDTEDDVSVQGNEVVFAFPNTTIQPGDTVTARSLHLPTGDDRTRCDQTETFPLN